MDTIAKLASKAGLTMPEVAIYQGAPNAFATGPSRSNSLVAVSTGLLQSMNKRQVEAVLAHEVAHQVLGNMTPGELPKEMAASGISGNTMKALFSSHPPLEERIAALQKN